MAVAKAIHVAPDAADASQTLEVEEELDDFLRVFHLCSDEPLAQLDEQAPLGLAPGHVLEVAPVPEPKRRLLQVLGELVDQGRPEVLQELDDVAPLLLGLLLLSLEDEAKCRIIFNELAEEWQRTHSVERVEVPDDRRLLEEASEEGS